MFTWVLIMYDSICLIFTFLYAHLYLYNQACPYDWSCCEPDYLQTCFHGEDKGL